MGESQRRKCASCASKERERVLAYVASIMAGDEESTNAAETVADEADGGDVEADDGEADDEGADEADYGERGDEVDEEDKGGGEDCELALVRPTVAKTIGTPSLATKQEMERPLTKRGVMKRKMESPSAAK